jgi:hypothetical protein
MWHKGFNLHVRRSCYMDTQEHSLSDNRENFLRHWAETEIYEAAAKTWTFSQNDGIYSNVAT